MGNMIPKEEYAMAAVIGLESKTIEKIWNKKFGRYVPKHWARTSDCEVHIKKVPIQPAWEYHIISIKRL